jgi:hypothetical protein
MHETTAHRHHRPHTGSVPYASQPYWGWSHSNQRMEFMDLPSYVDSVQQGYDAAFGDLVARMQQAGPPAAAAAAGHAPAQFPAPGPWPTRGGQGHHEHGHHGHCDHEHGHCMHGRHEHGRHEHGRHEHGHHGHGPHEGGPGECEDRDCGCGHTRDRGDECRHDRESRGCEHDHGRRHARRQGHDCRCDCCIVDADIIIYAHCGEVRVVPIEVANDTRKIRENVDVQVSEVRSAGGTVLAWPTVMRPEGPLTLEPCSTTRLELTVYVACGTEQGKASPGRSAVAKTVPADAFAALAAQREPGSDVDQCEVGYATIRLGGCLVRPIVVAIAALPLACDSYRTGCSCSCCC